MKTWNGERGFTLIEVVITIAIAGILIPLMGGILFQFQRIPQRTVARLPIQQEMRVATTWIRWDANKAQSFETGTGNVYGSFRWLDFSTFPATRHKVVYFWEEGTQVNPAAVAAPFNYGILFRQPYTEGVAEPKIPLIRKVANTADLTFTVTEEEHEANRFSTKRLLTVDLTATNEGGALGTLQESTTLTVKLRPEQAKPLEHIYYFLHNNPTPPTDHTNSQADLPLDLTQPTATTLFNYDADRDSQLGPRLIRSNNPAEADSSKFQKWVSATLSSPITIDGRMSLYIAGASFQFVTPTNIFLLATVTDLDPSAGGAEVRIGQRGGEGFSANNTWSLITVHFDKVTHTIPAGHKLALRVQFAGGIFRKCVNSQAVYPLSEQHGLEAQERR